ncbi:hypothetical protein TorRG33x02_028680, partial [Trema orientale]
YFAFSSNGSSFLFGIYRDNVLFDSNLVHFQMGFCLIVVWFCLFRLRLSCSQEKFNSDACACCRPFFFLKNIFWVLFIFSLLPFLFAIYVSFSFIFIFLLSSCSRLDHCPHI